MPLIDCVCDYAYILYYKIAITIAKMGTEPICLRCHNHNRNRKCQLKTTHNYDVAIAVAQWGRTLTGDSST